MKKTKWVFSPKKAYKLLCFILAMVIVLMYLNMKRIESRNQVNYDSAMETNYHLQLEIEALEFRISGYESIIAEYKELLELEEHIDAMVNATFILETGHGRSALWLNNNNAGGIKCGVKYCSYKSKDEGLEALDTLIRLYVDDFGYDIKSMREKYCQCGADDFGKFMKIYGGLTRG